MSTKKSLPSSQLSRYQLNCLPSPMEKSTLTKSSNDQLTTQSTFFSSSFASWPMPSSTSPSVKVLFSPIRALQTTRCGENKLYRSMVFGCEPVLPCRKTVPKADEDERMEGPGSCNWLHCWSPQSRARQRTEHLHFHLIDVCSSMTFLGCPFTNCPSYCPCMVRYEGWWNNNNYYEEFSIKINFNTQSLEHPRLLAQQSLQGSQISAISLPPSPTI